MKNRVKYILNYITKFWAAILFFFLSCLVILLTTVFNENYLLNILEKNNYYAGLHDVIQNQMSYQIVQAGFDEEVLENIFDEDLLRRSTKKVLDGLYNNNEINISTTSIEEQLNKNIEEYVSKRGLTIDDEEAVAKFVKEMANIYVTNVGYSNTIEKVRSTFSQLYTIVFMATIISSILLVLTYLGTKIFFKERNIITSLLTAGILLIFFSFYIKENIDINNITIYTGLISKIISNYINNILLIAEIVGIIYLIVALLMMIIFNKIINKLLAHKKVLNIILLIIWMVVIFMFSSQNAIKSTNTSNQVTKTFITITANITGNSYTEEELNNLIIDKTLIVRKSAHFLEYLILGFLVLNVFKDYHKISKKTLLYSLLFCILYATSDEIHQLFSLNRTCRIFDVFIDSLGASLGIFIYSIFYNYLNKYLKKHKKVNIMY